MALTPITLSEFRSDLFDRLGNSVFWSSAELDYYIREAMRTFNLLTGRWCKRVVIPTVANSPWVSLPTSMTSITRMERQGTAMKTTTVRDLDNGKPGWEKVTGTPSWWAPIALNMAGLYPVPSAADNSIVADGICATPTMSSDDDVVDVDPPLYEALLNYARHLALFKLGGREFAESVEARKKLWEVAGCDNRYTAASTPYRKIMGATMDGQRKPYKTGEEVVGIRR